MLTKEECLEALTEIKMYESISIPLYSLEVIENLIDEHFSNPPLKYEELKAGMWVWNNYSKRYMLIDFIREDVLVADELQYDPKENEYDYEVQYEPNRFYRKEVQE